MATAIGVLRGELSALSHTPVWSMGTAETEATLVDVAKLSAQAAQLQLRLLHHAARVEAGTSVGAASAATWFAHTRTTRPAAHRAATLAARLDAAYPRVDGALADAEINLEHAHVIVDAIDALPGDLVDEETTRQAEAFLLGHARDHDARALRVLGGGCSRSSTRRRPTPRRLDGSRPKRHRPG